MLNNLKKSRNHKLQKKNNNQSNKMSDAMSKMRSKKKMQSYSLEDNLEAKD